MSLYDAAEKGRVDIVKAWLEAGLPHTHANSKYDEGTGELSLERDKDGKAKGCTPLIHAASRGHPAVVKVLIAAGAEVNAKNKVRRPCDGGAACRLSHAPPDSYSLCPMSHHRVLPPSLLCMLDAEWRHSTLLVRRPEKRGHARGRGCDRIFVQPWVGIS